MVEEDRHLEEPPPNRSLRENWPKLSLNLDSGDSMLCRSRDATLRVSSAAMVD